MTTKATFNEGTLTITRVYDAPIAAVFEAWVETSQVQQWWGCARTTSVRSEIEPKVGGVYNHHLTLEGVGDVPGFSKFVVYDPPHKLAFASEAPEGEVVMTVTVEFTEEAAGTRVRLTHDNIPMDPGPPNLPEIIEGGWTAAFDKLSNFLMANAK